jgi:hypothetical protein
MMEIAYKKVLIERDFLATTPLRGAVWSILPGNVL